MGSKSQRRKQQHQEKQRKKRQRQQERDRQRSSGRQQPSGRQQTYPHRTEFVAGVNARHRQRLALQIPQAWAGELAEDVAVFDDSVLAALSPESAQHAIAVREALRDASESRGDEALKRVSTISRGSPLSEWRLFVRGLVDWLAGNTEAAKEAWNRLAPERRPGRIATSMMLALREDLENAEPSGQVPSEPPLAADGACAPVADSFDAQQLYHAKLLRKVRFDRAALRIAEAGLTIPEESKDLLLGPAKIHWLRQFIKEFKDTEPQLAAALSQAALGRAFVQNFFNLFDEATRAFSGPRHDRTNRLLTFFYYSSCDGPSSEKKSEQALDAYLNRELPQNELLPPALRRAIASQIHLNEAMTAMQADFSKGIFGFMFGRRESSSAVRDHLRAAVKAEPANGPAYKTYAEWIESKLGNDRLASSERTSLEKELTEVMRNWSKAHPVEIAPRLWLVDHFLENDQLEEARPHVEVLSASRHDNPLVRAMPWKWELLEAMRLCRRKTWLAEVPARLDEAEKLWPAWLSKQWLPYLRAAWTLRHNQPAAFEEQRRQICAGSGLVQDSLADACMMLGAAQRMRVGAEDLKPLRAALDRNLKSLASLPLDALIDAGGFFWDLQRAQLLYPAYRMHGSVIGKELTRRLKQSADLVLERLADERFIKAVLWCSAHRFWPSNYETVFPSFLSTPEAERQPYLLAARLNARLNEPHHWGIEKDKHLGPLLRAAAQSQRDAYYCYWFKSLADDLDDAVAEQGSMFRGSPFGDLFGGEFFGADDDEWDDDSSDDSLPF